MLKDILVSLRKKPEHTRKIILWSVMAAIIVLSGAWWISRAIKSLQQINIQDIQKGLQIEGNKE